METFKMHFQNYFRLIPSNSLSDGMLLFLIILSISLIVLYIAFKYIRKRTKNKLLKKILREYPTGLLTFGLVSIFLTLSREGEVQFFAMKIWWVVYWIAFLWWLIAKIIKSIKIKKRFDRAKKA